jgi:hypothetical protein
VLYRWHDLYREQGNPAKMSLGFRFLVMEKKTPQMPAYHA